MLSIQNLLKSLATIHGKIILAVLSICIAYVMSSSGSTLSFLIAALIIGTGFVIFLYIWPKLGHLVAFILPFVFFSLERFTGADLPVGVLIQALLVATVIIVLFKELISKEFEFKSFQNGVFYSLIVFFIYNLIQAFNPEVGNIQGWLFTLRGMLIMFASYFIGIYFGTKTRYIKQFFYVWISLSVVAGIYACYQEWYGLADFESKWIHADPLRFNRIFVKGRYRKFSLLSDPAAFGIFMSSTSIVAMILAMRAKKLKERIFFMASTVIIALGMSYSGTRTAYAMITVGVGIYILLTITNIRTQLFSIVVIFGFLFVLFGPIYGNATISRIRSTFNTEDASLNIRDVNRQAIQPYIHEHPIGGGLMTTGTAGLKYNPNHTLAGFPPDNGYLKLALEIGWVGLLLFLIILLVVLKTSIHAYYNSTDKEIRDYSLAFTAFIFSISIGLYAQTITAQVPMSIVFWPALGVVSSLKNSLNKDN